MMRTLRRLPVIALLASALLSTGALAQGNSAGGGPLKKEPVTELTGEILYQFVLAEIAVQRGQFEFAGGAFLDLARKTGDARIARRTAEIAVHSKQYATALEAVRLWQAAEPDSVQARQNETTLLLASGRLDELADKLDADLKLAGDTVGEQLMRWIKIFSRYPDKPAVQRITERITQPYLNLAEAHLARAQAAAGVGDAAGASRAIDEALRIKPDWELAALFKADLLSRDSGQLEFLQEFLSARPGANDVRLAYARALVAAKRYEAARGEFRRLLDSSPDSPDVLYAVGILSLQLNDSTEAEKQLKRFVGLGRGDIHAARFYLGQIADQAGRKDEALQWYGEVSAGEHVTSARIRAAQVLLKLNRIDEALQQLAAARDESDDDTRLLIAESQVLRDAGRHEETLALLGKALEAKPDDPDLLYETALAAEKLGQLERMERHLRRLIELKPNSGQGYNALGYSLADRNIRLDEAAVLIDKALSLAPADAYILDSKGWLLFRQGDTKGALELLQKAYAKKPDAEIAAHIGEVLWALGRRDEAVKIWREAAKAHPGNDILSSTIKRFPH